jgi:hypothetical protein
VLVLAAGCHSTGHSGKDYFASVIIHGNTPGQISEVTSEVFQHAGYEVAKGGPMRLVFEKEGSSMDNFAYGNWMDTRVWERVKITLDAIADETFRLEGQAYMLRDRGGMLEEEVKLSGMHGHKYQLLLDQVAARLHQPKQK